MSHPRDPRQRRQLAGGVFAPPIDAAAAAVRLEVAADAMRANLTGPEPEPTEEEWAATSATLADVAPELVSTFDEIAAEHIATAVQLGTVGPPLTAEEFAAALADEPATPTCFDLSHDHSASYCAGPGPAVRPPPLELVTCGDLLSTCTHTGPHVPVGLDCLPVAESSPPAPSLPPAASAPAPEVFISEQGRALTWRSRHDPRSLEYGIRPRLAGSAPMADRLWPVGPVLDQGAEGACVGFAVCDAANADGLLGPLRFLTDGDAERLYKRAQELDAVPGEAYTGTSVLAGMKAGVEAGLFGGYRWAFGTRDVAQAVLQVGPVVIGVPWLSGMYDTGPGGLVTLAGDDTGQGHCLAVVGIRLRGPQRQGGPYFVWQNSWGPSYGDGGLGYIHHRDLAELLHGTGEAAVPMSAAQHV